LVTKSSCHPHTLTSHHRPNVLPRNCNIGSLAPIRSSKRYHLLHTNWLSPTPSRYTQSFMYLSSAHTPTLTP
jgi:hypothetical protein